MSPDAPKPSKQVLIRFGTRPEAIKLAPVCESTWQPILAARDLSRATHTMMGWLPRRCCSLIAIPSPPLGKKGRFLFSL